MDAKSVITNPSPQAPLNHKSGFTVLSGLAWSGRGKIARVDVSLDGGRNWRHGQDRWPGLGQGADAFLLRARLGRPRAVAAVARHGRDRLRAADQGELRKHRGVNSIYHNNGIQTWHVRKNGEVENVEVS